MINKEKLKEAVEAIEKTNPFNWGSVSFCRHMKVVLNLAEQVLAVKGLPEHKECEHPCEVCELLNCSNWLSIVAYNKAIALCTLAVAKEYVHKSNIPNKRHDGSANDYLVDEDCCEYIRGFNSAIDAIIKAQEQKL